MKLKDINPVEFKKEWVKALRSGEYLQTQNRLVSTESHPGFCCLGVACDLLASKGIGKWIDDKSWGVFYRYLRDNRNYIPGASIQKFLGGADFCNMLAYLNDDEGKSFKQIANYIEKHI